MKKFAIALILTILACNNAFAGKTLVNITPSKKITTSNDKLSEGDFVDFKVVGTDKKLRGLIVKYQENGLGGQEAILVIDQFRALNSDEQYEGTISISGNQHNGIMEFFADFTDFIRGGEVTILPDKDIFSIWRIE